MRSGALAMAFASDGDDEGAKRASFFATALAAAGCNSPGLARIFRHHPMGDAPTSALRGPDTAGTLCQSPAMDNCVELPNITSLRPAGRRANNLRSTETRPFVYSPVFFAEPL